MSKALWMIFISFGSYQGAYARPEYALKNNIISCTVCHASPTGGGIRNSYGKGYGSHGFKLSDISEKAQWFQMDYRLEAFQSQNSATRKGLMTMTTIPSVNVPIQLDSTKPVAMNFVAGYGLGRLDTGLGYTYIRYNLNENIGIAPFEHIVVGRFNVPFGLMTDEHRNYTKISVPTSMRDYETGFMLSGTPKYSFHYDVAATNGTQGDMPVANDSPWALYLNTRFMPFLGPLMIGASASRHGTHASNVPMDAYNLYALLSIEKLTTNTIPLTFISEMQWARGWDNGTVNSGMSNFIPGSFASWQAALNDSRSQSLLLEADWNISPKWIALYRFEQFTPDTRFTADKFDRFSYGMKLFLNAQSSLWLRYERSFSTRPGVTEDGTARAVGNNAFLLFHFWL
jgi:hypothetical protein